MSENNVSQDTEESASLPPGLNKDLVQGRKRIFFFYNRPIQIRYAMNALMIIAGTIAVYSLILYRQVQQVLGVRQVDPMMDAEQLSAMAMQKFGTTIVIVSLLCIGIIGGAAAIWAMLITHRYEGPISRINSHLRDLIEGRTATPLKIRKRDEVHALVENLNLVLDKLRDERPVGSEKKPKTH